MQKIVCTIVFLCCSIAISFAQQEEVTVDHPVIAGTIRTDRQKKNLENVKYKDIFLTDAVSINLGGAIPFIDNGLAKDKLWNEKTGQSWQFGIGYKHQIKKNEYANNMKITTASCVGFGVGLGVNYMQQSAFMENRTDTIKNFEDIDGYSCEARLLYKDIKESISLFYLDIPLYLEIGKPSLVKTTGYLDVGVKASILLFSQCNGKGSYASTCYDEEKNVVYENVDHLNCYPNMPINEKLEHGLSRFALSGSLSGGVSIPFSSLARYSGWILQIGARVDYTILKVSKSIDEPYFKGANYRIDQSNMLNGNGNRILMFGIDIKFIRSKKN